MLRQMGIGSMLVAIALCLGCSAFQGDQGDQGVQGPTGPQGPPGETLDWSPAVAVVEPYTYLVQVTAYDAEGAVVAASTGTGFAITASVIATAGSVASLPGQYLALEGVDNVVTRLTPSGKTITDTASISVANETGILLHPRYNVNGQGVLTPDLGVFQLTQSVSGQVTLAANDAVTSLSAGTPLASCGFPDSLAGLYPNWTESPVGLTAVGVCSASRVYRNSDGSDTLLLNFDIDTGEGAEGAPVFDSDGTVLAVYNTSVGDDGTVRQGVGVNHLNEWAMASSAGVRSIPAGWVTSAEYRVMSGE